MSAPLTLTLKHNASEFGSLCAELAKLLEGAPRAFVDRFVALPNGVQDLFEFENERAAASGSNAVIVTIRSTELMNRLMATARAGDFDMSVFDTARPSSSDS